MIWQAAAPAPAPTLLREILTWGGIGLSLLLSVVALLLARRARTAARSARSAVRREGEVPDWRLRKIQTDAAEQQQQLARLGERVRALEGLAAQGDGARLESAEKGAGSLAVNEVAPPYGFVAEGASGPEAPASAASTAEGASGPEAPASAASTAAAPTEPATQASAAASEPATPVDFDGRAIRVSRALSHLGDLRAGADGRWLLYLNPDVEVNHVAYAEWSKIFELRGAAYARYRTLRPAAVDWDAAAGEGTMTERGVAEAIA